MASSCSRGYWPDGRGERHAPSTAASGRRPPQALRTFKEIFRSMSNSARLDRPWGTASLSQRKGDPDERRIAIRTRRVDSIGPIGLPGGSGFDRRYFGRVAAGAGGARRSARDPIVVPALSTESLPFRAPLGRQPRKRRGHRERSLSRAVAPCEKLRRPLPLVDVDPRDRPQQGGFSIARPHRPTARGRRGGSHSGSGDQCRGDVGCGQAKRGSAPMPCATFPGASRDHRSRLLSREIYRGGLRHPSGARRHRQDPDVLCPPAAGRSAAGGRHRGGELLIRAFSTPARAAARPGT